MAKPNIVTPEMWASIKTDYEFGDSVTDIALKFNLAYTTVYRKAIKEGWIAGEYKDDVIVIKDKINRVQNGVQKVQRVFAEEKILSIVKRQELINNFIDGAISLNLKNMRDVHKIEDAEKRIKLTSQMRANMADMAGVSQVSVAISPLNNKDEDSSQDTVQFYIPENGRD